MHSEYDLANSHLRNFFNGRLLGYLDKAKLSKRKFNRSLNLHNTPRTDFLPPTPLSFAFTRRMGLMANLTAGADSLPKLDWGFLPWNGTLPLSTEQYNRVHCDIADLKYKRARYR